MNKIEMKEVERHWEPNLIVSIDRSKDLRDIELIVSASHDGEDNHVVGGAYLTSNDEWNSVFDCVTIRVYGIIEYVAHALKQELHITLISIDGNLAIKENFNEQL